MRPFSLINRLLLTSGYVVFNRHSLPSRFSNLLMHCLQFGILCTKHITEVRNARQIYIGGASLRIIILLLIMIMFREQRADLLGYSLYVLVLDPLSYEIRLQMKKRVRAVGRKEDSTCALLFLTE